MFKTFKTIICIQNCFGFLPLKYDKDYKINDITVLTGVAICLIYAILLILNLGFSDNQSTYILNTSLNLIQVSVTGLTFFGNFIGTWLYTGNLIHVFKEITTFYRQLPSNILKSKQIKKKYFIVLFLFVLLLLGASVTTYKILSIKTANIVVVSIIFNTIVVCQIYFFSIAIKMCFQTINAEIYKKLGEFKAALGFEFIQVDLTFLKTLERKYFLLRNICFNFQELFKLQVFGITVSSFVVITIQLYYSTASVMKTPVLVQSVLFIFTMTIILCFLFYCHQVILNQASIVIFNTNVASINWFVLGCIVSRLHRTIIN